uniref:Lipase n=1 Tax=Salvator merianae TaxID=96440 RepID=A0A8D0C400_SALMN
MKMWSFIIVACSFQVILGSEPFKASEELVSKEIILHHGYPCEEYQVESEDGYILTIFRIPHGRENDTNKGPRPAVFLQHAFLGVSTHWISNLPNNSFGFILADAGYDVWIANSRGNMWSSKHKTLTTSEKEFWEFSFHEFGYYDIPALIYFILNKTNQEQLYFVGHSEGSAAGFIAFSSWPKLAERIKVFFALGPVTTLTFATTAGRLIFSKTFSNTIKYFSNRFCTYYASLSNISVRICTYYPNFCANVMSLFTGYNTANLNMSRLDVYVAQSPAGTSMQNLLHWSQIYSTNQFQAYDYGSKERNLKKYNQTTPPVYRIEDIKIPISVWTGGQDLFADSRDVGALCFRISNLIDKRHIPEWQHVDFIWGLDATERMYRHIIETMRKYP